MVVHSRLVHSRSDRPVWTWKNSALPALSVLFEDSSALLEQVNAFEAPKKTMVEMRVVLDKRHNGSGS